MSYVTKDSGQRVDLANGMVRDTTDGKTDYALIRKGPLFQRWAELLTRGAVKYGKNNWTLALNSTDDAARAATKARFLESACRHFELWMSGHTDEDHAAAVFFNINGYEAMLASDPLPVSGGVVYCRAASRAAIVDPPTESYVQGAAATDDLAGLAAREAGLDPFELAEVDYRRRRAAEENASRLSREARQMSHEKHARDPRQADAERIDQ